MANSGLNWRNSRPRTKMHNTRKLKDWLVHLNETAHFKQNNTVSCVFTKKKRRNGAVLRRHCFFFFFPQTCSKGRDTFLFSSLCLFLSFPCPLPPTSWWYSWAAVLRKQCLHWPPRPASWQRWQRAPHARGDRTGQGRPRSPCPYKYCSERWRVGGEKERKGRKRGELRERNRLRRERNDRNWETKKPRILTGKPRETVGEKEEKG